MVTHDPRAERWVDTVVRLDKGILVDDGGLGTGRHRMTYPGLVLRNLVRHPLRSLLTTLSIALSIFLVCAVLTLPSALDAILEQAASNVRISVHHKAGLTYWLPLVVPAAGEDHSRASSR